jgi:hypothetical protein
VITEPDLRETLARQAESYEVPPPDLTGLRAAALRRRRNTRLWYVGITATALLVAGLTLAQLRLDQGHVQPADRALTEVSGPAQLLAKYGKVHVGWVLVYPDGRVLSYPDHGPVNERRLTPSGVTAVRAGSLGLYDLLYPSPSPAGVWIDSEGHEYRPPAYAVCLWSRSNQPGELRALPAAARDILSAASPARAGHVVAESREVPSDASPQEAPSAWQCLRVGRADLVALEGTAARVNRWPSGDEIVFARSPDGSRVMASVQPMMPHGRWIAWGG